MGERKEQALSDLRKGLSNADGARDPPGRGARRGRAENNVSYLRKGPPPSKNAHSGENKTSVQGHGFMDCSSSNSLIVAVSALASLPHLQRQRPRQVPDVRKDSRQADGLAEAR